MIKTLSLLMLLFVLNTSSKAQYVTIPDPDFRSFLMTRYPACFNASQKMDTTCGAIVNETYLSLYMGYTSTDGLQYFKHLREIYAGGGTGSVGFSHCPGSVKILTFGDMPNATILTSLPDSLENWFFNGPHIGIYIWPTPPNTLRRFRNTNTYSSLPIFPNTLDTLECGLSQVSVLPALPDSLKYLSCFQDYLSTLPALPASLKYLDIGNNNFSGTLPALNEGLEELEASVNDITSFTNFPASLKRVNLGGNWYFASVPALPPGLESLDLLETSVQYLPDLPASLKILNCASTPLRCLPVVPDGTSGLTITVNDHTTCIPNRPSPSYNLVLTSYEFPLFGTGYSSDVFPLCNAVNNSFGCHALPAMVGHVYNDYNNNEVKEVNEPYRANVKVQLSNGYFTMTNSNGYYEITADNIGSYTLAITPPPYFTAIPLQYNYNFNSYDTVVTNDFPLQATAVADDISISVLPVNAAAKPGFSFPYLISYTNIGTTTLTPNIVLNYDNSRLNYNSSSNAAVINNGSSLTLAETAMTLGVHKSFTGYFTVKPTAVIGDSIKAKVSIHANALTVMDSTADRIRGAFDPNDKSATPSLSTSQVANGDYIYYTIRFQNTGTDTAINIVISDSLNGYLQPATLQVMNTSHPARVTVNGDMVYCEFLNIHLPDSNVNQLMSHGFITFKIKPQPTVTVNSIIPNKAAIYFDYNTPIITAEAQTLIYDPTPVLHTYTFTGTGNWTDAANWAGAIVPPSILQSGDLVIINGSCMLNIVVTANTGSRITVSTGKSFFVQGNLVILH